MYVYASSCECELKLLGLEFGKSSGITEGRWSLGMNMYWRFGILLVWVILGTLHTMNYYIDRNNSYITLPSSRK